MKPIRRDAFTGSNNIAKPERLPKGAVVEAVNLDFTVGGKAELRTGFELEHAEVGMRAVFAMSNALALVVGDKLVRYADGAGVEIATVGAGPVAAASHNGELFINSQQASLRVGSSVQPWAVQAPAFDVEVVQGRLPAGIYRVAVTAVQGVESGCMPKVVRLDGSQSLRVTLADDRDCRLYCSVANGEALYHQGQALSSNLISDVVDDTARCETAGLEALPFCTQLVSHQGVIAGCQGSYLYHTAPMLPHLHDAEEGFIAYPAAITLIASVRGGLFVCADKTYFVSGLGGDMSQAEILDHGAIEGSLTTLPDGSAAWFTRYGQCIGRGDGSIEQINRDSYAPDIASHGSAGYLEHNGNPMIVTTMRGETTGSGLRAGDHWNLEIINE